MRARVNFGSDGTKHVDILCRWGHNVKLHPDYIQTYNHGEYSVVLPVYGTQYCNVNKEEGGRLFSATLEKRL